MALPRESFLPTIKCSQCGNQVEISMMGEHICGPAANEPVSPPPEPKNRFQDGFRQPGRPPPQLNTAAANRSFGSRGQLTPVSQPDDSGNSSPFVPGQRPSPGPPRSPMHQQRPGGYGGFSADAKRDSDEADGQRQAGFLDRFNNAPAAGPFGAEKTSLRRFPTRKESLSNFAGPDDLRSGERPGTGYSSMSSNSYTITIAPPKAPRKNGYGGFGPPSTSSDSPDMGLQLSEPSPPLDPRRRRPSRSDPRSSATDRLEDEPRPSIRQQQQQQQQQPPPLSRTTATGQRADARSRDPAADFGVGNPYHMSSNSASSGYSSFSELSQTTAQTSPARSHKDVDELQTPMENLRFRSDRRRPSADVPYGSDGRGARRGTSPPRHGSFPHVGGDRYGSSPHRGQDGYEYGRNRTGSVSRRAGSISRPGSRDPVSLPSRGDCKACRLPIKGKSISSADGRLTGKYHKACFVCTTCSEPFQSTEFYVLGDKPYCEQHYHKLNGSLCGSCGRGIEGQYVEDEARVKYHIGCFRCLDCGRSLSDGYFEVDGKAYCERDAWRRTQPPPPMPPMPTGYGDTDPSYRGHRPGGRRQGSRSGSVSRGVPSGDHQPRRQMNKRMTRIGRI
ncbi:LIM domain-containing protein [Ophiocordyceps camponoti-floridani]|uniref:LIM domain-containing protein n=1 Tax=Ophiocordyceps camponoti-floridani TaxID=2030778 RepID=A0A8H4Q3G7_9HYPO|nr:LIM domain-containing protein [Ophiocordyceps camponoti-floridani]